MLRSSLGSSRSCIRYQTEFKPEELERVKLTQTYNDGTTRTKKCPVFSGKYGIESLLYVSNRFTKISEMLEFNTGEEKFEHWDAVLEATAEQHWDNLTGGIAVADRTVNRFNEEMEKFKLKYCNENARDVMIDYLRTNPECKKTHDADVREHGERLRTLFNMANQLPGTVPRLNEHACKDITFHSFPEEWQLNYESSAHDYAAATEQDILAAMAVEKVKADRKEQSFKRRSGGRSDNKRARGPRGQYFSPSVSGRSSQFRSYNQNFQRGGRGFAGRGFSGGRNFGKGFYRTPYTGRAPFQQFQPRGGPGRSPINTGRAPFGRAPTQQQYHYGRVPSRPRAQVPRAPVPRAQPQMAESHHYEYDFAEYDEAGQQHEYAEGSQHYHYEEPEYYYEPRYHGEGNYAYESENPDDSGRMGW